MEEKKRHIGIMGGTFDPVHNAHLMLAECAFREFGLNEVWMLPNGNPPHKRTSRQTDVHHRTEMLRLAIEDRPYLVLCGMEISSKEYHYTYETLRSLNRLYPDTRFYFIMGADSLFEFEEWKKPEMICQECILLAAVRDGCGQERVLGQMERLRIYMGADIRLLHTPDMDTASSEIRGRIARGESVSAMLPARVEAYIKKNGLYGAEDDADG